MERVVLYNFKKVFGYRYWVIKKLLYEKNH